MLPFIGKHFSEMFIDDVEFLLFYIYYVWSYIILRNFKLNIYISSAFWDKANYWLKIMYTVPKKRNHIFDDNLN